VMPTISDTMSRILNQRMAVFSVLRLPSRGATTDDAGFSGVIKSHKHPD
jgi:hypothetical protein